MESVWLLCQVVKANPQLREYIVQFKANGKQYVSFVPEKFVNTDNNGLWARIVADVDDGVLVRIPAETLTSGPQVIVQDCERNSVLAPVTQ